MATVPVRVPESLKERAESVKDDHDYATIGEAIRHMCRNGGYEE